MFLIRHCFKCKFLARGKNDLPKNFYDSLGVKKSATQIEIKTAYYELSKLHHPDTNKGSDSSLAKFREVSHAYETLGNVKSRKLYDRGLVVGGSGMELRRDVDEDDAETKFYKQREKRSRVPQPLEKTTVYDFDAWAKAHYDKSRERKLRAKFSHEKEMMINARLYQERVDNKIFALIFFSISMFCLIAVQFAEDNDKVIQKIPERDKVR